jgi:hypothetical protein
LSRSKDEPGFIYRIVTRNDSWVNHFDPESKKTEHAVEAPLLTSSEEIQEGAISRENDGLPYFAVLGFL